MTVLTPAGDNLAIHRAIYQTPPGWALVVATSGSREYGYFGDIMTTAASAHGVAGLVIDGGIRDLSQIYGADSPIFSARVSIRGTTKHGGGRIAQPVVLGEVVVHPGDIASGDLDGVVIVEPVAAPQVAVAARARKDKERRFTEELRQGKITLQLYGWTERREK